jgi:hypothetical protein
MWKIFKFLNVWEENVNLKKEIEYLKEQIGIKDRNISDQLTRIQDYILAANNQREEARKCTVVVDWKMIDAASLERNTDTNGEHTLLGLKKKDTNELHSWMFYCSRERHEELALEFHEYLNNKH